MTGGRLRGKTVVVVGGSSGIGRAIARAFSREDARAVVVADTRVEPREGGRPTHELIRDETAVDAEFVDCDVRVQEQVDAAIGAADRFGGVDVLVTTAGIPEPGPFLDVDPADVDRLLSINVAGVFTACRAAIRTMSRKGGVIITTSSVTALRASHGAAYSASKAAVALMSASLAAQFGSHGIRVNCLHPGFIATAMTMIDIPVIGTPAEEQRNTSVPLGRTGRPEDVARAAVFLASDEASFITGTGIVVDGGWTCHLPAAGLTAAPPAAGER